VIAELDAFVSYTSRDLAQVEVIAHALEAAGLRLLIDIRHLMPGKPWQVELASAIQRCRACIAFVGPGESGPWQQREIQLALDRQAREPQFSVIPVLLPGADPALGFLSLNTWIDLRNGISDDLRIRMLVRAIRDPYDEPVDGPSVRSATCPYRGLLQFREEDAPLFFGRESTTARLHGAIRRNSLVAVAGASGSGKSSILKAGLIPRLRREQEVTWEILSITPTERPFHALAGAFVRLLHPDEDGVRRRAMIDTTAEALRAGRLEIEDLVLDVFERQMGTNRLLLLIDQWEEIRTLAKEPEVADFFINRLLAATAGNRNGTVSHLATVIAVRGDFIGSTMLSHRELADRLDGAMVNVGPMTPDEVRAAVVEPANALGMSFEEGLVRRICDQAGNAPGHLPLLEFLLQQLWERRSGVAMQHSAFDAVGGLSGAVARYADQLFGRLRDDEQRVTRVLFTHIVYVGDGGEATSRRTRISDLPEEAQKLVGFFANERMVVTSRSLDGGSDTVEIAHEALIRSWATLNEWLEEDRGILLWRQKLLTLLTTWRSSGLQPEQRDKGALLRGLLLEESLVRRAAGESALSASEVEFIEESRHQRDMENNATAEQQRRELEQQKALLAAETERLEEKARAQEKGRQLALSVGALALVVVVGTSLSVTAIRQIQRAREQFARTEASELQLARMSEAYPAADSCQLLVRLVRTTLTTSKPQDISQEDQRLLGTMIDDFQRRFGSLSKSTRDLGIRVSRLTEEGDSLMAQGRPDIALTVYGTAAAMAERANRESPDGSTLRQLASAYIKVADVMAKEGTAKEARAKYAAAQKLLDRLGNDERATADAQGLQKLVQDGVKSLQ
jgi:TIR domain